MSTAKAKQRPVIIHRREPWADVDDEIRDVKAKIKRLQADENDAADKMEDTRWRAIGKAMQAARGNLDGLEQKRAEIMAGVWVEPVVPVAKAPQTQQQPETAAGLEYRTAETAALEELGLSLATRDKPFSHGLFAVFHKHLLASLEHMRDRIDALEESGIKAGGVWQRALPYKRGTVVSHLGSAWVALKDAEAGAAPQEDHSAWQLLVKRGRDAS